MNLTHHTESLLLNRKTVCFQINTDAIFHISQGLYRYRKGTTTNDALTLCLRQTSLSLKSGFYGC